MSNSDTKSATLSKSGSSSIESSEEEEDYCTTPSVFQPYRFEPLASPEQEQTDINIDETDEDGLSSTHISFQI